MKKLDVLLSISFVIAWTLSVYFIGSRELIKSQQHTSGFNAGVRASNINKEKDRQRCMADGIAFAIESENPRKLYRKLVGIPYGQRSFYAGYRHRLRLLLPEDVGAGGRE